jgi:hypothetical protein
LAGATLAIGLLVASGCKKDVAPEAPDDQPTPERPRLLRDMAAQAGIAFHMDFLPGEQGANFKTNLYDHGCGLAVADFDGDGYDDVYFVNQLGKNVLYRNKGDGTFEDVTEKAGVGLGDRICVGAAWADYDNSGRQSLFVTSTRGGNVLFKNLGDGKFEDVTKEAGVGHVGHSQTAVFFDYDNDGYLDLFVTNSASWTEQKLDKSGRYYPGGDDIFKLGTSPKEYNILYHNVPVDPDHPSKGRRFEKVENAGGLRGKGWGGDVAVFDYNDDGYLDILVTNMFGACQLYRNNGNGTFTDVTKDVLGRTPWGAIGSKAFDFNNDGKLDLLIVDMHSDMWISPDADPELVDLIKKSIGSRKFSGVAGPWMPFATKHQLDMKEKMLTELLDIRHNDVVFGNTLFRSRGGGKFDEVSDQAGMETFWPWGIATGDFDNDGFEDVFLPSGMGYPYFYWPNALMMNNGDGTFTDRAEPVGIEPPMSGIYLPEKIGGKAAARGSRCAATADFAHTGRLDIMVNNFNDHAYYFKNDFPRKNYVEFRLKGTRCNRDAIGALVAIHLGDEVMVRQVHGAGGYLSQSSKTVHFGLGDRKKIDRVEILWPRGPERQPQIIKNPKINTLHDVVEVDG